MSSHFTQDVHKSAFNLKLSLQTVKCVKNNATFGEHTEKSHNLKLFKTPSDIYI